MQISNIVYQEMLAPFNSMPLSYPGECASWKYPQQQVQELHQAQQQHHNFQDRAVRNQTQGPFHIPNLLEPPEVPLMKPEQLFYQNKSQTKFLNDLEQGSYANVRKTGTSQRLNSNSFNNKESLSQQDGCNNHTRREKPARAYNSNTMPQALPAGVKYFKMS